MNIKLPSLCSNKDRDLYILGLILARSSLVTHGGIALNLTVGRVAFTTLEYLKRLQFRGGDEIKFIYTTLFIYLTEPRLLIFYNWLFVICTSA